MSLVFYGVSTLILVAAVTWILAEFATPDGVSVMTADLSGLGRTVGLIAAAAVGVPAAVLAYHRQRALDTANQTAASQHEHKVEADNREHHTGRERHLRERYTTCAEQLGHDNSAIRLAGVYALASLADDWHEFGNDSERQVCIDLLCAYLRSRPQSPTGDDPQEVDDDKASPSREEQQVRTAIIRIIQSRTRTDDGRWMNCHFDLVEANLTGADLTGANLADANLSGANLRGANLSGANLTDARLSGANLLRANLFDARLTDADLTGANLKDANLTDANLTDADLTSANLVDADLTGARLVFADLTSADLTRADLTRANLTDANLKDADLKDADLTDADLTDADLTDTDLTRANLSRADLTSANLTDANLTDADLTRADLTSADLTDANLTDADLTDADLTDADLTGVNVTRASLTGVNLSPAQVTHIFYTEPPDGIPLPPSSEPDPDGIRLPATTWKNAALPDF